MKDKSKKHDHKGTKILKLSIFASVMLAPLFAIGFKCAYATFNKNAYQSYSNYYQVNEVNVNSTTLQQDNNNYSINLKTFKDNTNGYTKLANGRFAYSNISINWNDYRPTNQQAIPQGDLDTVNNFCVYYGNATNQQLIIKLYATDTPIVSWYYYNQSAERYPSTIGNTIYLTITSFPTFSEGSYASNYNSNAMYLISKTVATLDNAFYYAVDQMKDNDLFAWTKNTALYTPINAMTSGLGITTDAISVLLAYWLYITLIYVVFDIVIELFTYLSHLIMGNPIG